MWRRTNEVYVGVCSVYWRRGKEGGAFAEAVPSASFKVGVLKID